MYSGHDYLREKLTNGHHSFACLGKDGKPKFLNEKGYQFPIFLMVNALK